MSYGLIADLRERLERVEASRIRPRLILTTTELRELLDELDARENEIDVLVAARNKAQAEPK